MHIFQCENDYCDGGKTCLSDNQLCDGNTDCTDGFDEKWCGEVKILFLLVENAPYTLVLFKIAKTVLFL